MNLVGAEKRIGEYMRHVDILEKNYRHQLAAQNKKLIKVNTSTYELQHVVANLRLALRVQTCGNDYSHNRSTFLIQIKNLITKILSYRIKTGCLTTSK